MKKPARHVEEFLVNVREENRERFEHALKKVVSTPEGRLFCWAVIHDMCGVNRDGFTGNSTSFYRDGQQSIGHFLRDEIDRLAFDDGGRMYLEHRDAQRHYRMRAEAVLATPTTENDE